MTRKDYVAIAAALAIERPKDETFRRMWWTICHRVADVLAADNPRFNRTRFLMACGGEE